MPSSSEKGMIYNAGFGLQKIKLNLQHNADEVFKKICCADIATGDDEKKLSRISPIN